MVVMFMFINPLPRNQQITINYLLITKFTMPERIIVLCKYLFYDYSSDFQNMYVLNI